MKVPRKAYCSWCEGESNKAMSMASTERHGLASKAPPLQLASSSFSSNTVPTCGYSDSFDSFPIVSVSLLQSLEVAMLPWTVDRTLPWIRRGKTNTGVNIDAHEELSCQQHAPDIFCRELWRARHLLRQVEDDFEITSRNHDKHLGQMH